MTKTILVIGAAGMTGRRIVPKLAAHGATVRATRRSADGAHVRFVWEDPSTHAAVLDGVDAMYLVPPALVAEPGPMVASLLAAARSAGVRHAVLCSSLGVTFPDEPPNGGRRELERALVDSKLSWTLLRPGGFAQNFSEGFFVPGVRQGVVATATGDGAVAFVDAGDIADVATKALLEHGHDGATYALTGPEALTFEGATDIVSKLVGRRVEHRAIEAEDMTRMLVGFGLPAAYAAIVVRDQRAIAAGHAMKPSDDIERVLGRPPTAFADALSSMAESCP